MFKITVIFYETADGKYPAAEFIKVQNFKMRAKIYKEIDLLKDFGTNLRMPFMAGNEAILTNGFIKKTPRTPPSELALAKKYREDYLNRLEE